jgi:hypothetical protein
MYVYVIFPPHGMYVYACGLPRVGQVIGLAERSQRVRSRLRSLYSQVSPASGIQQMGLRLRGLEGQGRRQLRVVKRVLARDGLGSWQNLFAVRKGPATA